jgi:predicted N-acetyltransferase YhbS
MMNLQVRKGLHSDMEAISEVVTAAFGNGQGQEIVDLVSDLLKDPSAMPLLSLVATTKDDIAGHILFTKARVTHSQRMISSAILAPLSVHPTYQNQGIGGRLIKEGLRMQPRAHSPCRGQGQ